MTQQRTAGLRKERPFASEPLVSARLSTAKRHERRPMKRDSTDSCPPMIVTQVIKTGVPPMTIAIDTRDVCCAALELSKTSWVCAFAGPGDSKASVHKIKTGDVDR